MDCELLYRKNCVLIYIDLMASRFRFEDEGEQGPTGASGAQGATSIGAQGAQGLQGAQGAQGPSSGVPVGSQGIGGAQGTVAPISHDANMLTGGTIGVGIRLTYLPGGNWSDLSTRNNLPVTCDRFNFLDVTANMSLVGGTDSHTVYIPCYWSP